MNTDDQYGDLLLAYAQLAGSYKQVYELARELAEALDLLEPYTDICRSLMVVQKTHAALDKARAAGLLEVR